MWSYGPRVPRRTSVTAAEVRGPRRHLRFPDEFGVSDPASPAPLGSSQGYESEAALVQHELARQVIEQMARLGLSYAELATEIGVSVEQLRRMLRGESAMSVERMHHLARKTGLSVTVSIERTE